MSGSAVKFERREIRRAFGPEVARIVEEHGEAILELRQRLATVTAQHAGEDLKVWAAIRTQEQVMRQTVIPALSDVQTRRFLGRLRWVLTGR